MGWADDSGSMEGGQHILDNGKPGHTCALRRRASEPLKELASVMDLGYNCYLSVSKVGLIHYLVLGSH